MHEVFHLGVGLCTKWIILQSSLVSANPPDLRTLHWLWKCHGLSTPCPISWQYYASCQAYKCYIPAVTWEHRPTKLWVGFFGTPKHSAPLELSGF
uniref:Putative secreted protein n=1 Tax=Ixodes ricinus TaxID=34613 RepID=A0A6B0U3K4_IXORI